MKSVLNKLAMLTVVLASLAFIGSVQAEEFVTESCHATEKLCHDYMSKGSPGLTARKSSCQIAGHSPKQKRMQKDYCPSPCTFVAVGAVGGDICGPFHVCWCPDSTGKGGHGSVTGGGGTGSPTKKGGTTKEGESGAGGTSKEGNGDKGGDKDGDKGGEKRK